MGTRLLTDISATLDSNGIGVIASERFTSWTKITIHARATYTCAWTVGIGVGSNKIAHPIGFGNGNSITSGPFLLSPGEQLVITIAGGSPTDSIIGSVMGVQGVSPTELTADSFHGSTVVTNVPAIGTSLLSGDLGTGVDGDVVISAPTTLTKNMNYKSLTVNVGQTLNTGGYVIRCQGTVTNNGTIANNGSNGTNAPGGTNAAGGAGAAGATLGKGGDGANGTFALPATNGNAGGVPPTATVQGGAGGASGTGAQNAGAGGVTAPPPLGGLQVQAFHN